MNCIFCKIINKEINSEIVYENNNFIIIKDINPEAKVHLLAIPKKHVINLFEADSNTLEVVSEIFSYVSKNAEKLGLNNGFRVTINNGKDANQTVNHLHVHFL